jgi:heme-degrading monooxygenase HmoA
LTGIRRTLALLGVAATVSRSQDEVMTVEAPVVRMWRGVVRSEDRQAYVEYIERTGLREYRETPGNLEAWMLSRDLGDGRTEIVTLSRWESWEAIVGFAGDDIERAVFYPEDDEYLIERDLTVRHYRIER